MAKSRQDSGEQKFIGKKGTDYRLLSKMFCPVIVLDSDNIIVYSNPAFTHTSGFTSKDVIGKSPPYPFWPENKVAQYTTDLKRKSLQSKRLMLKKNGNTFWAEITLSQLKKGDPASNRLMTFQDLTVIKQMETKLRLAQSQVDSVLDAIPVPIAISKVGENTFTQVNRSFEQISGFTRKEMIGRKTDDLPWSDNKIGPRKPETLMKMAQINDIELNLNSKSGEPRTSIIKTQKVKFGNQEYMVAASIDITDRKKAEEALFASEYRYQSTLENMLEGCQIIGFDWRYLYVNPASYRQAGRPVGSSLGKTIMEVFPGVETTLTYTTLLECMQKRVSGQVEYQLTYEDRSTCWFELSVHPIPEGLFVLTVDINDRKSAEDEARRLLIQQQAILDNIPDMAWLKDKELRFIAVNQALLKYGVLTAEEVLGRTDKELFPERFAKKYLADDQIVIQNKIGITVEDPLPAPNGETVWFESSKMPLLGDKGEVVGLVGIARDITQRKKSQTEIQELNKVLRAIRDVNQIITQEKDPQRLLELACQSLTNVRGYQSCWIVQMDEKRKVLCSANSNFDSAFARTRDSLQSGILPNCVQQALTRGKPVILRENDSLCEACSNYSKIIPGVSVLVVPILHSGLIQGLLTVIVQSANAIDSEEINLLQDMTNDIGLALYKIQLERQRVKAENELTISEERFRMISEVAEDLIYRVNLFPQMALDYLSPSFKKMLGYSYNPDDLLAGRMMEMLHPDDVAVMAVLLANPASIESAPFVLRWRHQNGHYVHVEHRHSKILDSSGNPIAIVGIGRDITQRIQMEESLKASEMFSQRILEDAPNPMIVINRDSSIRYANPALFNLTGFSKEEIIGRNIPYPWWPTEAIAENQSIARRNREQGTVNQERIFQKKNGELFWVVISLKIILKNNQVEYSLSSWIDITERKKVELALQKSESYSNGLLSNAPNPILVTNTDTSVKYVNPAFEKLTGFTQNEIYGAKLPYPWWPVNSRAAIMEQDSAERVTEVKYIERQYQKKNGEYIWITLSVNNIPDENGVTKYYLANWVDITERKKVELALQASEEKTRLIFTSIADGVLISDLQGTILDCNDSTIQMAGVSKSGIIGKNITCFLLQEDWQRAFETIQKTIVEGYSGHIQYILVKPDGSTFPVDTISNIARDKAGNPLYLVVSFQDITERKQLEKRIIDLYETEKKQKEELQEEAKARGMFIDVLAHELRTPLTPILASTGMLNDLLAVSEEAIYKKLCANISNGAETLAHRLEELLDVARYSRGVFHLNQSPTNLKSFIGEAIFRFKPTLDQRNQHLITSISDQLPLAEADASRLEQVIINLLSNASKFSLEKGNIYFSADYRDEILSIEVRDEGIGITPEEQVRLFQPYHRVEQDRQKFPGIGLGLAVSKQIVEAHGGKIQVHSQLGQGSIFSVSIPLKKYQV